MFKDDKSRAMAAKWRVQAALAIDREVRELGDNRSIILRFVSQMDVGESRRPDAA